MIRKQEATGKTVDEARAKACALLGVQADDLNVSCEVLEMPQKTGFLGLKLTPAKVCVSVEEPDAPAAAPAEPVVEKKTPVQEAVKAAPVAEEPAAAAAQPEAKAEEPAAPAAEAAAEQPAAEEEEPEVPIVIEENAKIKAAVDYLREVIALMGVENVTFSAVQKGEATIIRLDGEKLGALIGRRGETMESLSYLASLVANRLEGDYIKLGLDVAGYRDKHESDLTALAQRIGAKVRKTGRSFAMEPMNPYERRIIHSASARWRACAARARAKAVTAVWSSTPPHPMHRPRTTMASAVPAADAAMAVVPAAAAMAAIAAGTVLSMATTMETVAVTVEAAMVHPAARGLPACRSAPMHPVMPRMQHR